MTTPVSITELPSFQAITTQGEMSSTEWRGHYTVIFFYPRNNTPGCTSESKDFRDQHQAFKAANCKVIGLSRDTLGSHVRVVKKLELPYMLVADNSEEICNMFGVMKHKSMFGKPVRGIERSTFLFDPQGKLVKEWRKVKVPGHVDEVLETLRAQG